MILKERFLQPAGLEDRPFRMEDREFLFNLDNDGILTVQYHTSPTEVKTVTRLYTAPLSPEEIDAQLEAVLKFIGFIFDASKFWAKMGDASNSFKIQLESNEMHDRRERIRIYDEQRKARQAARRAARGK